MEKLTKFLIAIALLITVPTHLKATSAWEKTQVVVINPYYSVGMFSVFSTVAGFLALYEAGQCEGVKVNFGKGGIYYQQEHGLNWWEYYCEPIDLGIPGAKKMYTFGNQEVDSDFLKNSGINPRRNIYPDTFCEHYLPRTRVNEVIKKYIHVKGHITEKVDQFVKEKFAEHKVVGVHYRGTDKKHESLPVPYNHITQIVKTFGAGTMQTDDYLIFVATDEQKFLDYMKFVFPGKVIYQEAYRSIDDKPIHLSNSSPYQQGEEAMVDCLLLSKCDCLVRTESNFGLWASYFNPEMPVYKLNSRYQW